MRLLSSEDMRRADGPNYSTSPYRLLRFFGLAGVGVATLPPGPPFEEAQRQPAGEQEHARRGPRGRPAVRAEVGRHEDGRGEAEARQIAVGEGDDLFEMPPRLA